MDVNNKNNKPLRVLLWSVPRSLSTVFEKCMSYIPNTQIINEPYTCAYHYGPEKFPDPSLETEEMENYSAEVDGIDYDLPMAFPSSICSYGFVKGELEAEYPGKDLVFCKDMAYALDSKFDMLPSGYRHTFIIRHPHRMFTSWRKMYANAAAEYFDVTKEGFNFSELPNSWVPKNYTYQEQCELLEYLQEQGGPEPIIIDADDLLENPANIMQKYCTLLGIPYSDDMLEWPAGVDAVKSWKGSRDSFLGNLHSTGGYYDVALSSTKFNPLTKMPCREDLPKDVLKCVDYSMPFYEKMYDLRLK